MNTNTYFAYKDTLEVAKDRGDKEAIEQIKPRIAAEHGLQDDADTLVRKY